MSYPLKNDSFTLLARDLNDRIVLLITTKDKIIISNCLAFRFIVRLSSSVCDVSAQD